MPLALFKKKEEVVDDKEVIEPVVSMIKCETVKTELFADDKNLKQIIKTELIKRTLTTWELL